MSELLSVPLKRGSDIDLISPLTKWISSNYGEQQDATIPISEINHMRQSIIKLTDRNEHGLLVSANYYDQISLLEEKINVGELPISFKWKDAFESGRKSALSKGKGSLTSPSIEYEKLCVLFNIGALNSWVAAIQDMNSADDLQKALKCLQIGAGLFKALKKLVDEFHQNHSLNTVDMKPETLEF